MGEVAVGDRLRVAVVGATGYTGAELLRLLVAHPRCELTAVVGRSHAGRPLPEALPSFAGVLDHVTVSAFDEADLGSRADAVFCALPHGASAEVVAALRAEGRVVFDLSADFRLHDLEEHERRYGAHPAKALRAEAVYGLPELHRDALRSADLVAVPGCFPTAAVLALAPLLGDGLASPEGLIVDAKTGVSGAGRAPSAATHFSEIAEGVRAYKLAGAHRHTPEIEQELGAVAGKPLAVTFTPHLAPMVRGILATCYATRLRGDADAATEAARARYADSPSVVVLPAGSTPGTEAVRGSNRAFLSYAYDARAARFIAIAAIDNLVKGAAGQAIQCLNVRFGFPEGLGLGAPAAWP